VVYAVKAVVHPAPDGRGLRVSRCTFVVFSRAVPFGFDDFFGLSPGEVLHCRMPLCEPVSVEHVSRVRDVMADFDRRYPGAQSTGNWDRALALASSHVPEHACAGVAMSGALATASRRSWMACVQSALAPWLLGSP